MSTRPKMYWPDLNLPPINLWTAPRMEQKLFYSSDKCPKCGSAVFLRLMSMNLKRCADCYHEWPWRLKEGQKPLVKHQR